MLATASYLSGRRVNSAAPYLGSRRGTSGNTSLTFERLAIHLAMHIQTNPQPHQNTPKQTVISQHGYRHANTRQYAQHALSRLDCHEASRFNGGRQQRATLIKRRGAQRYARLIPLRGFPLGSHRCHRRAAQRRSRWNSFRQCPPHWWRWWVPWRRQTTIIASPGTQSKYRQGH